jgi:hypothetical protein
MSDKKPTENQKKKMKLEEEFEQFSANTSFDATKLFPKKEDIPGLGENQEIYDYEADMAVFMEKARNMVENIAKLHLGDDPKTFENQMVKDKIDEDVESYALLKFIAAQSNRLYIKGLKDMDNGMGKSSMFEAIGVLQKDMRETIKNLSQKFKEIDNSYKAMKDTLLSVVDIGNNEEETFVLNMKDMNFKIDDFIKERNDKRKIEEEESKKKALLIEAEKNKNDEEEKSTEPKQIDPTDL